MSASDVWPDKRGSLFGRGLLQGDLPDKSGNLFLLGGVYEGDYLIREVAFVGGAFYEGGYCTT